MEKETRKGRIVCSLGGFYRVDCPEGTVECRARGVFRKQEVKPMVGDEALIELTEDGKGYVMEILPRKNSLTRPPLANLDQLLLVVSILEPAPLLLVLDKLIAQADQPPHRHRPAAGAGHRRNQPEAGPRPAHHPPCGAVPAGKRRICGGHAGLFCRGAGRHGRKQQDRA